jgi:hypothetical protein
MVVQAYNTSYSKGSKKIVSSRSVQAKLRPYLKNKRAEGMAKKLSAV